MNRDRNYDENEGRNEEFISKNPNWKSEDLDDLEDKWHDIERDYRNRYGDLTDEDVRESKGRFNEKLDRISLRRGKSRREIRNEIENW